MVRPEEGKALVELETDPGGQDVEVSGRDHLDALGLRLGRQDVTRRKESNEG